MPPEVYLRVRDHIIVLLQQVFAHVVVPTEMPSKKDYGDIDFFVGGSLISSSAKFDYVTHVRKIKELLNTSHGRMGVKTERTMFFAIISPDQSFGDHRAIEDESEDGSDDEVDQIYIQIDIKVHLPPASSLHDALSMDYFQWELFQVLYASGAKMLGSMLKPLGLTLDPEGLFIRVQEMDKVNISGSMVFLSREPKDVLKILGLGKRFPNRGFRTNEESKFEIGRALERTLICFS